MLLSPEYVERVRCCSGKHQRERRAQETVLYGRNKSGCSSLSLSFDVCAEWRKSGTASEIDDDDDDGDEFPPLTALILLLSGPFVLHTSWVRPH